MSSARRSSGLSRPNRFFASANQSLLGLPRLPQLGLDGDLSLVQVLVDLGQLLERFRLTLRDGHGGIGHPALRLPECSAVDANVTVGFVARQTGDESLPRPTSVARVTDSGCDASDRRRARSCASRLLGQVVSEPCRCPRREGQVQHSGNEAQLRSQSLKPPVVRLCFRRGYRWYQGVLQGEYSLPRGTRRVTGWYRSRSVACRYLPVPPQSRGLP